MSQSAVSDPLLQIGSSNGTTLNIDMDDIWLAALQQDRSGNMSPTMCASMSPTSDSTRSTSFFDEASFFDDFVDTFTSCASPPHQYGLTSNSPFNLQYSNQGQQAQLFQQRNHSYSDSNLMPTTLDHGPARSIHEGYHNGNMMDNCSPYNFNNDPGYGNIRTGIAMPQTWTDPSTVSNGYSFMSSYSPNINNSGVNMASRNTPPAGISRSQSMYTPSNTGNLSGRSSPGLVMNPNPNPGSVAPHTSPVLPAKITPNISGRNTSMDLLSLSSVSSDYFDTQTYYPSPGGSRSSGIAAAGILPRINANNANTRPYVAPPSPKSTISAYSAGQSSPAGYFSSSSSPRKRKLKGSSLPLSANTPPLSVFGSKDAFAAYGGSSSSRKSKKIHSMLEDLVTILRTMKRHDVRLKDLAASAAPAASTSTPMKCDPFASPMSQGYVARDCPTPSLEKLSLNTPNGPAPPQFLFGSASRADKDGSLSSPQPAAANTNRRKAMGLAIVRAMLGISGDGLSDICTNEAKFSYPQSFFPALRQLASPSASPMPLFEQPSRSPKLKSGPKDMSNRLSPRSSPRNNNARQFKSSESKAVNDSLPSSHVVAGQSVCLAGNAVSNILSKLLTSPSLRGSVVSEVSEDEPCDANSFFASGCGFAMPFVAKFTLKTDTWINANEPSREVVIRGMVKCVDGNGSAIALGAKLVFDSSEIVRQCIEKRLTSNSMADIVAAMG